MHKSALECHTRCALASAVKLDLCGLSEFDDGELKIRLQAGGFFFKCGTEGGYLEFCRVRSSGGLFCSVLFCLVLFCFILVCYKRGVVGFCVRGHSVCFVLDWIVLGRFNWFLFHVCVPGSSNTIRYITSHHTINFISQLHQQMQVRKK
jgi:hypothetical protein